MTRRQALTAAAALAVAGPEAAAGATRVRRGGYRADALAIRADVVHAWEVYCACAFGQDELRPRSRTGAAFFAPGHTSGLTIVEALDTFALMGLDGPLQTGLAWVRDHLDPVQDAPVSTFEYTIRILGGLLSAHGAIGEPWLLDRAREVGDRLLPAFATPTGIPAGTVNLKTGALGQLRVGLAPAGTHVAELGLLTRLTGDRRYLDASLRAIDAVLAQRFATGLLATTIDAVGGRFTDTVSDIAPPNDSFVESLYDGWAITGERRLLDAHRRLTGAMLAEQLRRAGGGLWVMPVDAADGRQTSSVQSALSAFLPGLLAQDGRVATARKLWAGWQALLRRFVLLPELVDVASGAVRDPRAYLRPEHADACLHLWLRTGDDRFRAAAARLAVRERRVCAADGALTVIEDVTAPVPVQGDLLPGYWWSEQTKYCWLMFARPRRVDLRRLVLSTEGNVLRGWK